MIEISVKADVAAAVRNLETIQKKRVQIATQRALIKTAQDIKEAEILEMKRSFDRPTRWTLGAIKASPVKNFTVRVGILDPDGYYKRANNYLGTQIYGGSTRRSKAMENALRRAGLLYQGWFTVPGEKAQLDSYGNQSVGEIKQILSWFGAAEPTLGSTQNMTDEGRERRRKGTKKKRGFEYFAARPGLRIGKGSWKNGQLQQLQPGIYRRTFFAFGSAIEPVLIFVQRASYKKRYDFYGIAKKVHEQQFTRHFIAGLQRDGL